MVLMNSNVEITNDVEPTEEGIRGFGHFGGFHHGFGRPFYHPYGYGRPFYGFGVPFAAGLAAGALLTPGYGYGYPYYPYYPYYPPYPVY